ncbi:hypothetical protein MSP8887_03744 [Marinomonas spartinae]|uniref:Uncharacterized protein n=1 Tax=Marinomonas spartinae TaxID=1792290 RepID=A0A1A8TLJ8_9GAMM|nr:HprK-related kinase B [Marinomonas spartinae]SBS33651.1 hypothetical protein MSP8886_02827 [Marinomonas spartinae]SBS39277.1 hypothetical protein MSP8887_03744 [Marinomonas spartinae]
MTQGPLDNLTLKTMMGTCQHQLTLIFGVLTVRVHANNPAILVELDDYYKSYRDGKLGSQAIDLYVVDHEEVVESVNWQEVPREVGKRGRKEGYLDHLCEQGVFEGRWIKKFKTGMLMLQRLENPVVVGPCQANLAQVINFINNQFLNLHLRNGFLLGHAAAFSVDGNITAIAAGSGGGKSTLMLRCLEKTSRQFVTNDRILMRQSDEGVEAVGVAKLPRVNPGTLLNSERLKPILTAHRQEELLTMTKQDLWQLEEKYDVQIEDKYGPNRVELNGKLRNLVMLDWSLESTQPTQLVRVDLTKSPDTIEGLRKRPGPFYQDESGAFADLHACDSVETYCDTLNGVQVFRLTGAIDFDKAFALMDTMDSL